MSISGGSVPQSRSGQSSRQSKLPWLDVIAIALLGIALLKLWLTGQLFLLIHPNYTGLTVATGVGLLLLSGWKGLSIWQAQRRPDRATAPLQHMTLLPNQVSSGLLLLFAIAALTLSPKAFGSQTALDRGVTDTLTTTRVKPQAFRSASRSQDQSLIDWIRTLQVRPEPDLYTGKKVKVQGFVVHPPDLPRQYFAVTRFVITCCAADAYPVSLPVKVPNGDRQAYRPDTWWEISGQMITETLDGRRQLAIQAKTLKPIPEPKNPYNY